jgi:hypothetical protein
MLSVALKDLCNKYQVFILTSTQLNGSWIEAKEVNQNLLRGAKSIADKVDLGCIIMPLRDFELEKIQYIIKQLQCDVPTIGIHFYKNRRSKYKDIIIPDGTLLFIINIPWYKSWFGLKPIKLVLGDGITPVKKLRFI